MNARPWMFPIVIALFTGLSYGQPGPDNARIEALVKKLGHASFVQREAARKELEAIGVPALEPLRKASNTADTETNRRIADLIRLFEERIVAQRILAPKEVHLKLKDATVQQAIGELASVSGYPIQFVGDATRINDKKITLDTAKIPFWQAVDQLCAAAGLMEKVDVQVDNAPQIYSSGLRRRIYYPPAKAVVPKIIYLTPRGNEKSLISHAGSIRTELRVARDAKTRDLILTFVVSIEPKLLNSSVVGRPVFDKLVDQAGRAMTQAPDVPKAESKKLTDLELAMMLEPEAQTPPSRFTQTRIKDGPEAAKLLKEIAGKLDVQVDVPNETLIKMPDIMQAAGKSATGHNGGTLKVQGIKKEQNGAIEIQVALENLSTDPFGGTVIVNGNNIIIRGNIKGGVIVGPNGMRLNGTGSSQDLPDLIDAKGQKFKAGTITNDSVNFVNGSVSRSATIVYQPNPAQAEPRELVLFGPRMHTIAVPFRFESVTVP